MMKKWMPGILCGGLLAASLLVFAADEDQAPPSLGSVYNLAVANELSPRDVTLAYVHALVAQRKLELTKAHIDFVKQEVKAASGGLFHHADQDAQESVEGSVDLTQADYFAAQAEYQANLQYLNQLLGKAYDQVQSLKNDAAVANLDPQLKARYNHVLDETQQLKAAEMAYHAGQVTAEQLIQTEQGLYTAQEEYWDQIQAYLSSEIKTEGAPSVIADLQEGPGGQPQNHWAMADTVPTHMTTSGKVAELLNDSRQASAADMLKATQSTRPIVAAAAEKQVKQIELAAQSVKVAAAPVPPVTRAPSLPALPQPEPLVSAASLKAAPIKPIASEPVVHAAALQVVAQKPAQLAVTALPTKLKQASIKQAVKPTGLATQSVKVAAPIPPVTRAPSLPALPQPEPLVSAASLKAAPIKPIASEPVVHAAALPVVAQKPAQLAVTALPTKLKQVSIKQVAKPTGLATQSVKVAALVPPVTRAPSLPALPQPEPSVSAASLKAAPIKPIASEPVVHAAALPVAAQKPAQLAVTALPAGPKLAVAKQPAKQVAENKQPQQLKKTLTAEIIEPRKLVIQSSIKKTLMSQADLSSLFASIDISEWTGPEEFHAYILPLPSGTAKTQLSELLPAPQSTKFEYV